MQREPEQWELTVAMKIIPLTNLDVNIVNQVELMKVTSPIEQKNWKLGILVIG